MSEVLEAEPTVHEAWSAVMGEVIPRQTEE